MSNQDQPDDKIDDALAAWPDIKAADEDALATKTLNRIRANFPPKSKLTLPDDALVGSPFPAQDDESQLETDGTREIRSEIRQPREKSSQIDVPIGRASSIPPPSSGVARSERSAGAPAEREPSQQKAEVGMGQVERQRDRTSFKDLAKLAATPPPASTRPASARVPVATPSSSSGLKSDSGVVDLQAAALSDPNAAERAKSTPLASGSLFDEDGPISGRAPAYEASPPSMSGEHMASGPMSAVSPVSQRAPQQIDPYSPASVRPSAPPAALSAGRISAVPMSVGPHSAVAAMQTQAAKQSKNASKSGAGLLLGSLFGVAAVAAGVFLYVHGHRVVAASPDLNAASNTVAQAAATQAAPVAPTQDQPVAAATDTVSPDTLAVADDQNGTKSAAKSATTKKSAAKPSLASKDSTAKVEVDAPGAPPAVAKADVKPQDEAPPVTGGSASLQNAMQTAAGPSDSTNAQAVAAGPKFAPGSVPQRPSQGALASAIGRVLPDARSCLGPDDGVSYANIQFESTGGVQNVTLSGYAAGKPAGTCITTALKKASISPFAEPTYSAKVTVRP